MALIPADTDPRGALGALGNRGAAPAGPAVVLGGTLAVGAFSALMALALLVAQPDGAALITRLTVQQDQGAKTALYLAGFAVVTPLAGLAGHRLAGAIARGPNAAALTALSAVLAGTLAAVLLLVKASAALPWGDGLGTLLAAVAVWAVCATTVLWRTTRGPWPALDRLVGNHRAAGLAATSLAFLAVLCFTNLGPARLAVLAAGLGLALVLASRADVRLPRLPRRWGLAVDLLVLALVALAIPDLVVFTTSAALPNVFTEPGIIQFHHDFLLGPTNQVLGGGTLLVDSPVSQYGVGSVYFLAAFFQLAPIGYGTYALLDGLLTAGYFAAGYCVLRLAGTPRGLAAAALGVAVVALVLALDYSIGALPQQGPLRFGLPMVLVLATTAALRWPHRARLAGGVALAVVALSSIWALEAFAFTLMTLAALLAAQALLRPAGDRWRWLARRAAQAAAACVLAHVVLAGATLAASGELPDWGQYLAYLQAFLGGGEAGELTYGFEPWSPGLPMAALYAVSAIGLGVLLARGGGVARRDPVSLVALAGLTAYGIALFSYAQNRSSTYLLPYVALPALLAAVLWVGLALRTPEAAPRAVRAGGLVALTGLGLVLLLSSLPVGERFSRSALAHARPGGGDLRGALERLWDPPPIDPRAPEGQRLLAEQMPGRRHVLVLLPKSPELGVEVLMRSGRAHALPVGNPVEESFVPDVWAPPLRRAIARLQPGERILADRATLETFASLRARPGFDPLVDPRIGGDAIDEWILKEIGTRFDLGVVARGTNGMLVAELRARRA